MCQMSRYWSMVATAWSQTAAWPGLWSGRGPRVRAAHAGGGLVPGAEGAGGEVAVEGGGEFVAAGVVGFVAGEPLAFLVEVVVGLVELVAGWRRRRVVRAASARLAGRLSASSCSRVRAGEGPPRVEGLELGAGRGPGRRGPLLGRRGLGGRRRRPRRRGRSWRAQFAGPPRDGEVVDVAQLLGDVAEDGGVSGARLGRRRAGGRCVGELLVAGDGGGVGPVPVDGFGEDVAGGCGGRRVRGRRRRGWRAGRG